MVHNETATGVTSDIPRIRQTMHDAGSDALLLVRFLAGNVQKLYGSHQP